MACGEGARHGGKTGLAQWSPPGFSSDQACQVWPELTKDCLHLLAAAAPYDGWLLTLLPRCVRRLPWRSPHPQLEALLNGLPSLTPGRGPPQLQYSAALLLSAYTPWLADHLAAAGQAGGGTALLNRWALQLCCGRMCLACAHSVPCACRHLCLLSLSSMA